MPATYEFHSVPIESIQIDENRQRKELKAIDELADSIKRNGLLHPIIVRHSTEKPLLEFFLVAGERRFRAIQALGWKTLPVHFLSEISDSEAKAIELEENIKRVDLTWQENSLATLEYHNLLCGLNYPPEDKESWTIEKTAESIGLSRHWTGKLIRVARGLKDKSPRVLAAESFSAAFNAVKREQARVVATTAAQIKTKTIEAGYSPSKEKKLKSEVDLTLLTVDFNEWARYYNGPKFNFIHCDFPYGIGYDKTKYRGSKGEKRYNDSLQNLIKLINTLDDCANSLLYPSAHLMFWFSMTYYDTIYLALEDMGFNVNPFPLIWSKNKGIIPDPERTPRRVYETAFLCSLGDRKIIQSSPNLVHHPVDKSGHISTKPKAMLESFFKIFVDDLTEMLDPTCGSGTALAAAKTLGVKRLVGLDIEQEYIDLARTNINLAEKKL